jgi:hypothetical protein
MSPTVIVSKSSFDMSLNVNSNDMYVLLKTNHIFQFNNCIIASINKLSLQG